MPAVHQRLYKNETATSSAAVPLAFATTAEGATDGRLSVCHWVLLRCFSIMPRVPSQGTQRSELGTGGAADAGWWRLGHLARPARVSPPRRLHGREQPLAVVQGGLCGPYCKCADGYHKHDDACALCDGLSALDAAAWRCSRSSWASLWWSSSVASAGGLAAKDEWANKAATRLYMELVSFPSFA